MLCYIDLQEGIWAYGRSLKNQFTISWSRMACVLGMQSTSNRPQNDTDNPLGPFHNLYKSEEISRSIFLSI